MNKGSKVDTKIQKFTKQTNKSKNISCKQIPQIDTESSEDENENLSIKDTPVVPSRNYVQGLSYDIDENDLGDWKIATEKKSKKNNELEMNFKISESNETNRKVTNPTNKQSRRKKPINKVPGMTD